MDDITQQMNAVALLGNSIKSDATGNFNAGLYKYLSSLLQQTLAQKLSGLRLTKT
jgi:hypothetical protein